jgi:hypothetical protein
MEQRIEQGHLQRAEVFSKWERNVAKFAIGVSTMLCLFWSASAIFPDAALLGKAFAYSSALLLIIALLYVVSVGTRDTARGVTKLVRASRGYSGKLFAHSRAPKSIVSYKAQKHTCRARTNARAHRSASRSIFACTSKNSSDDGESDQGDPSNPPHTVTLFQNSPQKSNSFSVARLCLDSWIAPCRKCSVRGRAA